MAKRKKRLIKQIKGLQKQIDKHEKKITEEKWRKDTTHDYWRGEIEDFEEQIEDRWNRLIKLKKKK